MVGNQQELDSVSPWVQTWRGLVLFQAQRVDEIQALIVGDGGGTALRQFVGLGHVYDAHLVGRAARVRVVEGNDEFAAVVIVIQIFVLFIVYQLDFLDIKAFGIEHQLRLRVEMRAQREQGRAQQVLLFVVETHIKLGVGHLGENGGGGLDGCFRRQPGRHHEAGRRGHGGNRRNSFFMNRYFARGLARPRFACLRGSQQMHKQQQGGKTWNQILHANSNGRKTPQFPN